MAVITTDKESIDFFINLPKKSHLYKERGFYLIYAAKKNTVGVTNYYANIHGVIYTVHDVVTIPFKQTNAEDIQ